MKHAKPILATVRSADSKRTRRVASSDDDLVVLAQLAQKGVHDPSTMPFLQPWTDQPSPLLERGVLQWGWRHRSRWSAKSWNLNCVVLVDEEIVGVQDLMATDFATTSEAKTGSWLGLAHQGHGIGSAMREAMLSFAFLHLDAQAMLSGGFPDNEASLGVSRARLRRSRARDGASSRRAFRRRRTKTRASHMGRARAPTRRGDRSRRLSRILYWTGNE
jgi:RimJ/RimL family protein N-acetyltransferase